MQFYQSIHNLESKRPVTLEPVLWRSGDVISSDDLPAHDIERLEKHGDLLPLSPDEARRDAARAQTWYDTLQLRKSKNLHVDPQQFKKVERDLKAANDVAKVVAG